jgi:hypothetical protein
VGRIPVYILAVSITAALLIALPGCAPSTEQQTLIVPLRDDAIAADVEILQNILVADDHVCACVYTHESTAPADGQTVAPAESWLEITLAPGTTEAERDSLLRSLEADPVFDRSVPVADSGDWWSVK